MVRLGRLAALTGRLQAGRPRDPLALEESVLLPVVFRVDVAQTLTAHMSFQMGVHKDHLLGDCAIYSETTVPSSLGTIAGHDKS